MTIHKPEELPDLIPEGSRLLGLDVGSTTIGLAISDSRFRIATTLTTVRRRKFADDAAQIASIVAERNVGGLVVGLPLNMDGSEGPRAQSVRDFTRELLSRRDLFDRDLVVAFWDERMSTMAAQRIMIEEADLSRKRRARSVDRMAAAYILQGALDAIVNRLQEK
ncbi:MAG: Holliday junction resolvase RuvX [Pseudomonadota bacterium]|nr:Holliday junction resolvase RuvX [Pseudomonadota bacterium]